MPLIPGTRGTEAAGEARKGPDTVRERKEARNEGLMKVINMPRGVSFSSLVKSS